MDRPTLAIHPDTAKLLASFKARPSHAVLLVGREGLGKTILARDLIASLLSVEPAKLGDNQYTRIIAPENGRIAIQKVREITQFFTLVVPGHSGGVNRIVLVEDADAMTREAQNAFLKLLEEPPVASACILTSSHPERLLATLRSRVQIIPVHQPEMSDVIDALSAQGYEATAIKQALLTSGNNIAAAWSKLSGTVEADNMMDTVKKALAADTFGRLTMVDSLAKDKEKARLFAYDLAVIARATLETLSTSNAASDKLKRWHSSLEAAHAAEEALQANTNAKLVCTELMLSL